MLVWVAPEEIQSVASFAGVQHLKYDPIDEVFITDLSPP